MPLRRSTRARTALSYVVVALASAGIAIPTIFRVSSPEVRTDITLHWELAPGIVEALRRIDDLVVAAAAADPAARTVTRLARATAGTDEVTAVAAVHAFGHLPRAAGQRALLALLASGRPHLREHAAWALGATGARITGKTAALLKREGRRFGLATQCIGGGQGIATVLEAV